MLNPTHSVTHSAHKLEKSKPELVQPIPTFCVICVPRKSDDIIG